MATLSSFLSAEEREKIVAAIREAEGKSIGEIKVYFEKRCKADVLDRALEIFSKLKLHETRHQTGILIYVAYEDKLFAIIGDKGIHAKVPENFWDETKTMMEFHFRKGQFSEGLLKGIHLSGEQLRKFFEPTGENPNEISDDIVIADE